MSAEFLTAVAIDPKPECHHEDCHAAWRCTKCGEFRGECPPIHAGETIYELTLTRAKLERLQRWAAKVGHLPECAHWKPWTQKGCTCGLVDLMLGVPEALRETSLPQRMPDTQGWTLDTRLIRAIHDEIRGDDFAPSEEGIELVLLAFEKLSARRLADYGPSPDEPS